MSEDKILQKIPTRTETDSIGEMELPADAYYGLQTWRAHLNFPISGHLADSGLIYNLAKIKKAAAIVNRDGGALSGEKADAIIKAAEEVIRGKWDSEFIVDAIQGGAGTSTNMNMNEVLANRAIEILGGTKGDYSIVHPNDDVNMCQSTNDVIPTAGKLAVLDYLKPLTEALEKLREDLLEKAGEFRDVLKIGRTQMEDAVPMRLGQTFRAYAVMVGRDCARIRKTSGEMLAVNMGATAIGTGINAGGYYQDHIIESLREITGYDVEKAEDLFDATENLDGFVMVSAAVKACAINLSKMCNDLRLLASGPRAGLGEINLPPKQNGSSIMPGKVNPVIPEVVNQVAFDVVGNDVTIALAAESGQMELNAFEPVVFYKLFSSIRKLTSAVRTLCVNCIEGITVNREHCRSVLESTVGIATALCPYIGYKKAEWLAKESLKTNVPVRDLVRKCKMLGEEELDRILDPVVMTEPIST